MFSIYSAVGHPPRLPAFKLIGFLSFFIGTLFALSSQMVMADNHGSMMQSPQPEAIWLDVRNQNEYAKDHIPGDLNIAIDQLKDDIGYYIENKHTPIKVYCQLGKRAKRATDQLLQMGYTDVECIGTIDQARERRGMPVPADSSEKIPESMPENMPQTMPDNKSNDMRNDM